MTLATGYGLWFELILALAVGTAVIVGLAALAARLVRFAVWQRTFWQVAVLTLLGMTIVELTGTAPAVVSLWRAKRFAWQTLATARPASAALEASGARKVPVDCQGLGAGDYDPASWLVPTVRLPMTAPPELAKRATETETPAGAAAARETVGARPSIGDLPDVASKTERRGVWWPGVIWALGVVVLAARTVWARGLLLVFRRRCGAAADGTLCGRVNGLARRLGVGRPVAVLEAAGLTTPVAFGSLRPAVVLPAGFAHDFDAPQQEAMLAHELAHLAAGDPAWQLLADLSCAVLWWHPLAWWCRRRLWAASEAAADEASLLVPGGPHVLAACLVTLGRRLSGPRRLGWLSVAGPRFRSGLGRRVQRLIHLPAGSRRVPRRRWLVAAKAALPVALVVVAISCTAWAHPQVTSSEGGTAMNVLTSSWRRSLAATVVLALWATTSAEPPGDNPMADVPVPAAVGDDHPEREVAIRQLEEMKAALHALLEGDRKDAAELLERAIRAREVTLEGRRDDEANMIRRRAPSRRQLAEVLTLAAGLWREFRNEDKAAVVGRLAEEFGRADRERKPEPDRPRRERERREVERRDRPPMDPRKAELVERRRELEEEAGRIKRVLAERARDEEAEELEREFDRIHKERVEIERELAEIGSRPRQLAERMRELNEAIGRAKEAGREEEAERLERERREIARELGGPPARGPSPRAEGIMGRLAELKRHFGPRHPKVQEELARLRAEEERESARLERQRAEEERARHASEARRELEERARDIERRLHELRDDQDEEARRLEAELREIHEHLGQLRARAPEEDRRLRHVMAAIENLHAAGLHDEAEHLERELRERAGPPRRRLEPPEWHGPGPEELDRVIDELHRQMDELRHQMAEIQEQLERLARRDRD